ncbi:hypothetical protein RCH10_005264 [Variovorax sp. GrIS 2.14]|jgi:hypothetical protein|uniref:2OG-Fe dioxygenase family protein n=1 Tax=unclassified Variovorax TaxID=663243 RepID=UPI002B22A088|nr:2OG-Fe dioxygenase family protein [Variovorax sp. RTB1]MEB0110906.1 2OG-Fe dioxygenase family protein [Variovorax sp. RTB1]
MNLEKAARELTTQKFSFMTADEWTLNRQHPDAWKDFTGSWDRLATDNYMKEGDAYRERRFCKYTVDSSTMTFEELNDFVFHQTHAINLYAGGRKRDFAPVEPKVRQNRILQEIIKTCLQAILCSVTSPATAWKVYVHQFRIRCSSDLTGQPTPEGMHCDGHDFISMHLMNRVGIQGGISTLSDDEGNTLKTVTLKNRMDGLLINDRALRHGVSQITPTTSKAGHRDMLVIDYNRES